jgi:hypothetical protein
MRIALFQEDVGHERFIGALIKRLADEVGVSVQLELRNARGGASQLDQQFVQFLNDNVALDQQLNLVVVIRDTDCVGVERIKTRYSGLARDSRYSGDVVIGAPEPTSNAGICRTPRLCSVFSERTPKRPFQTPSAGTIGSNVSCPKLSRMPMFLLCWAESSTPKILSKKWTSTGLAPMFPRSICS